MEKKEQFMPKETIRIDRHALGPYCDIAGILGMTVSSYVERHLERYRNQIRDEGLVLFARRDRRLFLRSRRTVADRFEQFAIETKFGGRPNIGTISTAVVPTEEVR